MTNEAKLRETLHDIIEGKIVKRSKHELTFDGNDISNIFVETLRLLSFLPATVGSIELQPGERVPAFYLDGHTAYFGWIFWEKFTHVRLRKLFGSVVRNAKGDWQIQITSNSTTVVYVNRKQKLKMDIDRPFSYDL